MNRHEERAKIEGLMQFLHPDNPNCELSAEKILIVLQKVQTQVLLDVRDILLEIRNTQEPQDNPTEEVEKNEA